MRLLAAVGGAEEGDEPRELPCPACQAAAAPTLNPPWCTSSFLVHMYGYLVRPTAISYFQDLLSDLLLMICHGFVGEVQLGEGRPAAGVVVMTTGRAWGETPALI